MTREEAWNRFEDFDEAMEFITDNELYDFFEERNMYVMNDDQYASWVEERLDDDLRAMEYWEHIRDWLYNLPCGYDWYYRNDWDDVFALDGGREWFDNHLECFIDYLENNGYFKQQHQNSYVIDVTDESIQETDEGIMCRIADLISA